MSANPQLLIVDDDTEFLEILERRLSRRGYTVTACTQGSVALETAANRRFDVAIIDRMIPGAGELELVTRLKAMHTQLPIIVLSGSSGSTFEAEARHAGACEYLTKPCSLDTIEAALASAFQASTSNSPLCKTG
jgi:two-component system, OmpR family, response regulator